MLLLEFSHMERTCPFPSLPPFCSILFIVALGGSFAEPAYCNDKNITVARSVLKILIHLLLFIYGENGSFSSKRAPWNIGGF